MLWGDPMDWTWTSDGGVVAGQSPRPSSYRYRYHVSMVTRVMLLLGLNLWSSIT